MAIFVTGGTGYLGSYIVSGLLRESSHELLLLVRAGSFYEALEKLWFALQLHMDEEEFLQRLPRIHFYLGDLTRPQFGLPLKRWEELASRTSSIIHCAASLNRRSERACLNVNLRGTLHVIQLAQLCQARRQLTRFSFVSTVAVAGERQGEVVSEPEAIDWQRRDYDPYARTKKFCEYMVHQLLPDVPKLIFRPSIVLGDSRFPETTQFDMARAFVFLARLPVLPFRADWRLDIVNADFVGDAIVKLHLKSEPKYDTYHLSSGRQSPTYASILEALRKSGHKVPNVCSPFLLPIFRGVTSTLSEMRTLRTVSRAAALLKVFLPYLTFDTVFDNSRATGELGRSPVPFEQYAYSLYRFVVDHHFRFPYRPLPEAVRANTGAAS